MGVANETRTDIRARAKADLAAVRDLRFTLPPARWDTPTLYPSWQQGGPRECMRPTCDRIRDIGDRTGLCPPHASRFRRPDPTIQQVQQHIEHLIAAGATTGSIARAAGVAATTIRKVRGDGPESQTGTAVRWAIVGLDPDEAIWTVPRWRISRRLRSLVAAGWGVRDLRRFVGVDEATIRAMLAEPYVGHVDLKIAQPILDAWPELEAQPVRPLDRHLRPWMVERRWPVPAEWDDIDAPDCDPTPCVDLGPDSRLPSLNILRHLRDEYGPMLASRFTGQTARWLDAVCSDVRPGPVRSRDYDIAVSGARREFHRLRARRKREREAARRGGAGRGVGDGAAVASSAA